MIKHPTITPALIPAWPWQRCRARYRRRRGRVYYGRCDLRKGHTTEHALERGFDVIWFNREA